MKWLKSSGAYSEIRLVLPLVRPGRTPRDSQGYHWIWMLPFRTDDTSVQDAPAVCLN